MFSYFRHIFTPTRENVRHPHVLRFEVVGVFVLVALVAEMAAYLQIAKSPAISGSVIISTLFQLTNVERAHAQEGELIPNDALTRAAQLKANDMASKEYFSHTGPDNTTPWYWMRQAGYTYSQAGENLAIDFTDSDAVVIAWMNSPAHRANILKSGFTEMGIALAQGTYQGHPTVYVVQMFGTPSLTSGVSHGVASTTTSTVANTATSSTQKTPSSVTTIPEVLPAHTERTVPTDTIVETKSSITIPQASEHTIVTLAPTTTGAASLGESSTTIDHSVATTSDIPEGEVLAASTAPIYIAPTILERMIASPLGTVNKLLLAFAILFSVFTLLASLPVHSVWIHRHAFGNGIIAVIIVLILIGINTLSITGVKIV